jgi:hypothetical protein
MYFLHLSTVTKLQKSLIPPISWSFVFGFTSRLRYSYIIITYRYVKVRTHIPLTRATYSQLDLHLATQVVCATS